VPIEHLEAAGLQQVVDRYFELLRRHRSELDLLNVYPVPDGDTGTNMSITVESVRRAVSGADGMDEVADRLAAAALTNALGNSGIILAEVLRAVAGVIRGRDHLGPGELAESLDRATTAAYAALAAPVEGTILTVLRESATAVREAVDGGAGLEPALRAGYERAVTSLRETPRLLPVLAREGVVDAGGAGYLLLLAAMVEEVGGEPVEIPAGLFDAGRRIPAVTPAAAAAGPRYEVMFLLEAPAGAAGRLQEAWRNIGESIVVAGGPGEWNCHIHTDHIGAVVEAALDVGRPHRMVVVDLVEQAAAEATPAAGTPGAE
jgi:dihydroxyacetone kinase-like predicted kinase